MKKGFLIFVCIIGLSGLEFVTTLLPVFPMPFFFTQKNQRQDATHTVVSQCTIDTTHLKDLEQENESLRKQLSFATRTSRHPLLAHTIGMSTDPFHSLFIIDKGSRDGIAIHAPVIAGDGILVGTIFSVKNYTSAILPLTDPRSKVLAHIIQHDIPINGIAQGQFNVGLLLTLVPITAQLGKDDLVITSGLQDSIPAGLAIGTVQNINKRPEDLFQSASIDQGIHLDETAIVSVLIPEVSGKN